MWHFCVVFLNMVFANFSAILAEGKGDSAPLTGGQMRLGLVILRHFKAPTSNSGERLLSLFSRLSNTVFDSF